MKKLNLIALAMTLIVLLCTTSCGDTEVSNILDQVPANAELVAVGNIRTIVESAGGELKDSKIKLPRSITDLMDGRDEEKIEELNDRLASLGINLDAGALVFDKFDTNYPVIIFSFTDKKKFTNCIEDEGFSDYDSDGDITFFKKKTYDSSYSDDYDQYTYIAVCGSYAYLLPEVSNSRADRSKPTRVISRLIENAKDEPFSKTAFAKFINGGNAGGIAVRLPKEVKRELKGLGNTSDLSDLLDGVTCIRFDLQKEKAVSEIKVFTAEGKDPDYSAAAKFMDFRATIDKKALSYLSADEQLVFAAALKDINWGKYINNLIESGAIPRYEASQLEEMLPYLKQLDGTFAIGFGLTKGLESIANLNYGRNPLPYMSFTVVLSTKEGKAPSLLRTLKDLMDDNHIPYESTSEGLQVGKDGQCVYLKADGNYLIASNNRVPEGRNKTVEQVNFTDHIIAAGLYFNRNAQLLEDLGINNDIKMSSYFNVKEQKFVTEAEIAGSGPDGFIARVISICTEVYDNRRAIEKKMDSFRPKYDYGYDYDDYEPIEEVAVEAEDNEGEEVVEEEAVAY